LALFAVLAMTSACKRLKTGAREHFSTEYSCPEDRVTVQDRDDLKYGDFVVTQQREEAPSDEVQRDPARLAKWRSDVSAKREELRRDLNLNLDMFDVRGCDHRALLGCCHSSTADGSMNMGEVDCSEAPSKALDAAHPKAAGLSSPPAAIPDAEARRAVQAWSDALDGHHLDALPGLYADRVRFYGRWLPRSAVVAAKRAAFASTTTFRQEIVGEIAITFTEHDDTVRADFVKRSGASGKAHDVRARLGLQKSDAGGLVVAEETDDVTERQAAPQTEDGGASDAAAHAECSGTGLHPYGCDSETQVCVAGGCQTCPSGTRALMTECKRECRADKDCPHPQICNFIAGDLFVCTEPAATKACPKGQIFLKSDGACWTTCNSDNDCPKDMCCRSDFNSPSSICMGKCWDVRE
jgi:hypothetical protein